MAGMSEARNAASPLTPIKRGDTRRAATMRSGSSDRTTASEKAPWTRARATRTPAAKPSSGRSSMAASMRWASTSVSVSDSRWCPDATSSSLSSTWFSMIPLCTRANWAVQSTCGWAFPSVGPPCVAHRVWPIPAPEPRGAPSARLPRSSSDRVPLAARARHRPSEASGPTRAIPAESYPRYSSRPSPSSRTARTSVRSGSSPEEERVMPMMPHMDTEASGRRGPSGWHCPGHRSSTVAFRGS